MNLISPAEVIAMVDALGGETVVYVATRDPVYDPATGTSVTPKRKFAIKGVWSEFQRQEVDGVHIMPQDAHFVTHQEGFPVLPKLTDWIERGTEIWSIVRIGNQPNDPFLDLQVRRGEK